MLLTEGDRREGETVAEELMEGDMRIGDRGEEAVLLMLEDR